MYEVLRFAKGHSRHGLRATELLEQEADLPVPRALRAVSGCGPTKDMRFPIHAKRFQIVGIPM